MQFDYGAYLPADPPLRPDPVIWIDPTAADREHLNFSYFHEISHHIIRNDNDLYSFLSELANSNEEFNALVDRYANIGAAEFLIPSDDILTFQESHGFSIRLFPELDQQYPASKPAIAVQMAECASHRCFVVICQFGFLPSNNGQQDKLLKGEDTTIPRLYVQFVSKSPSLGSYTIGKNALIPEDHLFFRSYKNREYITGRDNIPFKSGTKWVVNCEALFYKEKVYGVFNITNPVKVSALQPRLF